MSPSGTLWLERRIWTCIYGGLFTVVIGLAVADRDLPLAWSLGTLGGCVTAAGVVLVWIRARVHTDS